MEFCQDCNNMLIPKDDQLYCRTCEAYYEMTEGGKKSTRKIIHKKEEYEKNAVVTVSVGEKKYISEYLRDEDDKIKMFGLK